jgi:CRP-like cAMP-binding protein
MPIAKIATEGRSTRGGAVGAARLPDDRQLSQVLACLRGLIRAKGLHNRDIASSLDVTERTVTRWLAGRGLTMRALQQLCGMADITLMELFETAGARLQHEAASLTRRQEQELVDDPIMALFFEHIRYGFPTNDLKDQLGLSDSDRVLALVGLEKLGLIELLPGDRVRLLVSREIRWLKNGPRNRALSESFGRLFGKIDFCDPALISESKVVHLSAQSVAHLQDKFDALLKDIIHLSELDRRSGLPNLEWHALLLAARRLPSPPYASLRRKRLDDGPK